MTKEEALAQFLKNEEKLWDLAALTAAPTMYQFIREIPSGSKLDDMEWACSDAYDLADALMKERRRRLGFTQEEST